MDRARKYRDAIYAGIMGDALGVPVEFSSRQDLALCSVKNMLGYGRYDQPEGTWSDDTSLSLCTMESLRRGYDIEDMGRQFCKWLFESTWTATGFVFDAGLTTFISLDRINTEKISARTSGGTSEDDLGNGSLMRILPAALFFSPEADEPFLEKIHEISAITHAHPRAKIACGIYALVVRELIANPDLHQALRGAVQKALGYYSPREEFKKELSHFIRIVSYAIPDAQEEEINSSGYVIDTLEAALWCSFRHATAKDVLLAAVNLGMDTDTTGMVAGGIAGLAYGLDTIPEHWLRSIALKKEIDALVDSFIEAALKGATA